MNTIKYSDLNAWNDWDVGCVLEKYASEIKQAENYSYSEKENIKKRYIKLIKLQVINFGHVMETNDFAKAIKDDCFTPFDGIGYFMNEDGIETHTAVPFNVEKILEKEKEFPYVVWYNK